MFLSNQQKTVREDRSCPAHIIEIGVERKLFTRIVVERRISTLGTHMCMCYCLYFKYTILKCIISSIYFLMGPYLKQTNQHIHVIHKLKQT